MSISTLELRQITDLWPRLAGTIRAPHSEKDYGELVEALDQLMATVGKDKNHPLASLMEVLGVRVENYEKERPMATEKRPEG